MPSISNTMSAPTITEAELDSLFMDIDTPTNPLTTFTLLSEFPAELKNMVYEAYFNTHLTSINITTSGSLIVPNLLFADKSLHAETKGYFTTWLSSAIHNPDIAICAEVQDYNPAPLQARLEKLSGDFNVPVGHLTPRVRPTFTGACHMENLLAWIDAHVSNPEHMPVYYQGEASTPFIRGFGHTDAFGGSLSLVECVRGYRVKVCSGEETKWRRQGVVFLEYVQKLGVQVGEWERGDGKGVAKRVFEVVGRWHHDLLQGKGKMSKAGWMQKGRRGVTVDIDAEMANLVYGLWAGIL